jgi:dipeptidyl aminopeptidase/acylaminoacyl peptidase
VLLYDARAGGESTGDSITFGYRERRDLIAAVNLLKDRGHTDIACLGVSQGGATILFAADDLKDVKCVICESVYDEMRHAVDRRMRHYTGIPGSFGACLMVPFAEQRLGLTIDVVKPVEHIGKLPCPVFVISGENDDRTSPEDTQRLFDAAREPKELWMLSEARHEDLFHFAGYEQKVQSFLKRHFK